MKVCNLDRGSVVRAGAITLGIALLCIAPARLFAGSSLKVIPVAMPGASGAANNIVMAFDRYAIIAPFAPSIDVDDETELSSYDNHYVNIVDTRKPESVLRPADLKACYFPSRIAFDPNRQNVYARGVEYVEVEKGQYEQREVISFLHLNLDENGKPYFDADPAVPIRIRGINEEFASFAPDDFALGHKGSILAFTNGAAVFTYDVLKGYVVELAIIPERDFGPDNYITHLSIDQSTNTLIVVTSKRTEGADGKWVHTSELYFSKLEANGTIAPGPKRILSDQFPKGTFITPGSNAIVTGDAETHTAEYAYFMVNDGSLFQVDLRSPGFEVKIERVASYPEFAQDDSEEASPRILEYDASKRLMTIVRRGGFVRIQRPVFARPGRRPGRIQRPVFVRVSDSPALAIVQFNKKNKVSRQKLFVDEFQKDLGLTGLISDGGSQYFGSTYTGRLFSLDVSQGIENSTPTFLGQMGSRIEQLTYSSSRSTFVAINSIGLDDEGLRIKEEGSLLVARLQSTDGTGVASSITNLLMAERWLLAIAAPSIQRPCTIRH